VAKTTLNVPDISCEHCEHTIIGALKPQAGIEQVAVDIEAKQVHVTFDECCIDLGRIKAVLEEEDYPVTSTS
jgi:copper chaperone